MTRDEFKHLFSDEVGANGFYLMEDVFVFRNPLSIWDSVEDKDWEFNSLDELLEFEFKGRKIIEYIEEMDSLLLRIDGSTGSSGGNRTFKFGHAGRQGKDESKQLFPAYANVRIKSKTLEGAMDEFHERFENADHEWAYEVDSQGYVHQYVEGNRSSVSVSGANRNNMILHNHPSGGAFSDSDLISTAMGNERGIVASGRNGDYIFQKNGGHFRAKEFVKAVRSAKLTGKSYDDAVDRWMRDNQKTYGYTYRFNRRRK